MKLKTINESINTVNESTYTPVNMAVTDSAIKFESLDQETQKKLANAFGDAWDPYDLIIDLKKIAKNS